MEGVTLLVQLFSFWPCKHNRFAFPGFFYFHVMKSFHLTWHLWTPNYHLASYNLSFNRAQRVQQWAHKIQILYWTWCKGGPLTLQYHLLVDFLCSELLKSWAVQHFHFQAWCQCPGACFIFYLLYCNVLKHLKGAFIQNLSVFMVFQDHRTTCPITTRQTWFKDYLQSKSILIWWKRCGRMLMSFPLKLTCFYRIWFP